MYPAVRYYFPLLALATLLVDSVTSSPIRERDPLLPRKPAIQALINVYNVSNPANPAFMGYFDAVYGFTYGVTSDPKSATIVSVDLDDLQPGDITLTNENYGYSVLGFCALWTNLVPGPWNWAYMAASIPTPKNSPPVETDQQSIEMGDGHDMPTETAIWYLSDWSTYTIKPVWIDLDGTTSTISLVYLTSYKYFIICKDCQAFLNGNPLATYIPVHFQLNTKDVPPAS